MWIDGTARVVGARLPVTITVSGKGLWKSVESPNEMSFAEAPPVDHFISDQALWTPLIEARTSIQLGHWTRLMRGAPAPSP